MTDRIEKTIVLQADRARVWSAISEAENFGVWFGVELDGPFVAGQEATGRIVPTLVDPEVAKLQESHRNAAFTIVIGRIEPMRLFSFRWHPYAIDPMLDYSGEPMTLVVFELTDVADGTLLTITESGFDRIPVARRGQAIEANTGGWTHQTLLIEKYLAQANGQR